MIICSTLLIIGYRKLKKRKKKEPTLYIENKNDSIWKESISNKRLERYKDLDFLGI